MLIFQDWQRFSIKTPIIALTAKLFGGLAGISCVKYCLPSKGMNTVWVRVYLFDWCASANDLGGAAFIPHLFYLCYRNFLKCFSHASVFICLMSDLFDLLWADWGMIKGFSLMACLIKLGLQIFKNNSYLISISWFDVVCVFELWFQEHLKRMKNLEINYYNSVT